MNKINVVVDRSIGYIDAFDNVYPINYGYVPGIIAGDNEEQDAYIIGINYPIKMFIGYLLAEIKRADDNENKWVVSTRYFSKYRIIKDTKFIEQYFNSHFKMKRDLIDFFDGEISQQNVFDFFINFLLIDAFDLFDCKKENDKLYIYFDSLQFENVKFYFESLTSKRIKVCYNDEKHMDICFDFNINKIIINIILEEKIV